MIDLDQLRSVAAADEERVVVTKRWLQAVAAELAACRATGARIERRQSRALR